MRVSYDTDGKEWDEMEVTTNDIYVVNTTEPVNIFITSISTTLLYSKVGKPKHFNLSG